MIVFAHKNGFQCAIHAVGDRAITACVDGFVQARQAEPKELRHYLVHCDLITDSDIRRVAANDIGVSAQPILKWVFSDAVDSVLGLERVGAAIPPALAPGRRGAREPVVGRTCDGARLAAGCGGGRTAQVEGHGNGAGAGAENHGAGGHPPVHDGRAPGRTTWSTARVFGARTARRLLRSRPGHPFCAGGGYPCYPQRGDRGRRTHRLR